MMLPTMVRRLFIRVWQRAWRWLPLPRLQYPDIALDLVPLFDVMAKYSLIDMEKDMRLSEALATLQLPQLKLLKQEFRVVLKEKSGTKEDHVSSIATHAVTQRFLFGSGEKIILNRVCQLLGRTIRIKESVKNIFDRIMLLFFMVTSKEENKSLSTLLLQGMGKVQYAQYPIVVSNHPFISREALLDYQAALDDEELIMQAVEVQDWSRALKISQCAKEKFVASQSALSGDIHSEFANLFTAQNVWCRIIAVGAHVLERMHNYTAAALELEWLLTYESYSPSARGRYWDRLSVDYQHVGKSVEAFQACMKGLADPHVRTGHRLAIRQRALKICEAKKNLHLYSSASSIPSIAISQPLIAETWAILIPNIDAFQPVMFMDGDTACAVEELVLRRARKCFWKGIHCEGGLSGTLFGLLFWDIIFAEVPNVFLTPYQVAPLDFGTNSFALKRSKAIDSRLLQIQSGNLEDMLLESWQQHYPQACVGVNWEMMDVVTLCEASSCIERKVLVGIMRRLAYDYRHCRGGMPDLFLYCRRQCKDGSWYKDCKFVEVKSPNDHLSRKQEIWLHELREMGACVAVCRVKAGVH